ncbi:MAG: NAD(P)-dependent oxidoreductase, partial [Clostridia bacterium]|nr:NAD(P)-dependent oxidoreductase [Clostridia bacterium]
YNSANIRQADGTRPELLVYAGVRAEKYLANRFPDRDRQITEEAARNIRRIAPEKLVLISTVDVWGDHFPAYEDEEPATEGLHAYGLNRLLLEREVRRDFPDALIVRLPGLYGQGLKKNFLYDLMSVSPALLTKEKYEELAPASRLIAQSYEPRADGFFALTKPSEELKRAFENAGFTALCFTDSRARFQFYPLTRLQADLWRAMDVGITLLHAATEPVTAAQVYRAVRGSGFHNELSKPVPSYDLRTRYAAELGGKADYLVGADEVLADIRAYVLAREGRP